MLWTAVAVFCLAALLPPVTSYSPRLQQWLDSEDLLPLEVSDEPSWRLDTNRELGDDLMTEKRALSVLSRWKPFTDTFRTPGRSGGRGLLPTDYIPRGVELVSAETRGTLRPHGQPLRWGRR